MGVYTELITLLSVDSSFHSSLFCVLWGFFIYFIYFVRQHTLWTPGSRLQGWGRVAQGSPSGRARRLGCSESRGRGASRPGEGPWADLQASLGAVAGLCVGSMCPDLVRKPSLGAGWKTGQGAGGGSRPLGSPFLVQCQGERGRPVPRGSSRWQGRSAASCTVKAEPEGCTKSLDENKREAKENAKTVGLSSWRANADINLDHKGCQRWVSGRQELCFACVEDCQMSK